jgi:OmpA-OmpF porin, OOP family
MSKWLIAVLSAAAMTVSAGALAQQSRMSGWYVGGDIGKVDFGSEDDTGFRILGGYQLNRNFAAELGYGMLFDKGGAEVTTWELVGIGSYPLANNFSIFGKLGFAMWETEVSVLGLTLKEDGTDLTYGFGVQYDVNPRLAIRGQWQRYDVDPDEADMFSIGLIYRF